MKGLMIAVFYHNVSSYYITWMKFKLYNQRVNPKIRPTQNILSNPNYLLTLREKCPYSELFWSECGKMRTRITPNTDTFYTVHSIFGNKLTR